MQDYQRKNVLQEAAILKVVITGVRIIISAISCIWKQLLKYKIYLNSCCTLNCQQSCRNTTWNANCQSICISIHILDWTRYGQVLPPFTTDTPHIRTNGCQWYEQPPHTYVWQDRRAPHTETTDRLHLLHRYTCIDLQHHEDDRANSASLRR